MGEIWRRETTLSLSLPRSLNLPRPGKHGVDGPAPGWVLHVT